MTLIDRKDVGGLLSGRDATISRRAIRGASLRRGMGCSILAGMALCWIGFAVATAQTPAINEKTVTVRGVVHDEAGKAVSDANIRLERTDGASGREATTSADGGFAIESVPSGDYGLTAEKAGRQSRRVELTVDAAKEGSQSGVSVDIVLEASGNAQTRRDGKSAASSEEMEFSDSPSFTIAAVTDWTAAGGHGSDAILRTSESLTRDAVQLKGSNQNAVAQSNPGLRQREAALRAGLAAAPGSFDANFQLGDFYLEEGRYREAISLFEAAHRARPDDEGNEYDWARALQGSGDYVSAREHVRGLLDKQKTADLLRMAGELDEKLGDPVAAVNELEQAVRMDGSEGNYFEWGSELLLHRAILQAKDVFGAGAQRYRKSARMLTALGAALFASSNYDEAAEKLCDAADLSPGSDEPYLFLGKAEIASPNPLPCSAPKLAEFEKQHPENTLASYYDAMAIWKQSGRSADAKTLGQVEALLNKAVALDPKCGDAYLQLGNLHVSRHDNVNAIALYGKAIEANPQLAEAHYRLGLAYDRVGDRDKAKQEFQIHEDLDKQQAAEVERQRREVKQFLVKGGSVETANP
jgi:tetratricopeptide (TPR) repeat protein